MVHDRLKALLEQLHNELEKTDQLDASTRSQVEAAAADLDDLLARKKVGESADDDETLHDKLLELEVEHPRVAAILGEAADLLSKLGI
jgi:hypothetical protein